MSKLVWRPRDRGVVATPIEIINIYYEVHYVPKEKKWVASVNFANMEATEILSSVSLIECLEVCQKRYDSAMEGIAIK